MFTMTQTSSQRLNGGTELLFQDRDRGVTVTHFSVSRGSGIYKGRVTLANTNSGRTYTYVTNSRPISPEDAARLATQHWDRIA